MWPKITLNYSPNFNLPKRTKKKIKFIIIHYTGMKKESEAIERLCDDKSKVSSHYFIRKDGTILRLVPDLYEAWHAGKSKWKHFNNLNKYSIGIEIQNKGHYINYQNFTKKQIFSLIQLIKKLLKKYKIKKENVLGHSDIAPLRKLDPGEKFPWRLLSKKGAANWFRKYKYKKLDYDFKTRRKIFFKNIYKIGYRFFNLSKQSKKDRKIILAFQRRYLPNEMNGKITNKTLIISQLLA